MKSGQSMFRGTNRTRASYVKPAKSVYDKSLKTYTNYNEGMKSKFSATNNIHAEHAF